MNCIEARKLNSAVKYCLDQVCDEERPLARVADFVDGLRNDASWRPAEIAELEEAVLHSLTLMGREADTARRYQHLA